MISLSNILTGSDEQNAGLEYLPNSRTMGPVKVVAGRYYLIPFSLKTDLQIMPVLMSVNSGDGLVLELIGKTVINTTITLSQYDIVYKSIGFYLYGGYCSQSNPNWSSVITFGRSSYSSFAYSIDEAQGFSASPILQPQVFQTNVGTLATPASGDATYLAGLSMVTNQYPMVIGNNWTKLSDCFDESIVPNLLTGFSSSGDPSPSWTISTANGQPGPYLESALIACEMQHA